MRKLPSAVPCVAVNRRRKVRSRTVSSLENQASSSLSANSRESSRRRRGPASYLVMRKDPTIDLLESNVPIGRFFRFSAWVQQHAHSLRNIMYINRLLICTLSLLYVYLISHERSRPAILIRKQHSTNALRCGRTCHFSTLCSTAARSCPPPET